jgi:hypothetical protein
MSSTAEAGHNTSSAAREDDIEPTTNMANTPLFAMLFLAKAATTDIEDEIINRHRDVLRERVQSILSEVCSPLDLHLRRRLRERGGDTAMLSPFPRTQLTIPSLKRMLVLGTR